MVNQVAGPRVMDQVTEAHTCAGSSRGSSGSGESSGGNSGSGG